MATMWNFREVHLPFSSLTPHVSDMELGVTPLVFQYLLGDIWQDAKSRTVARGRVELTLSEERQNNPILALQLLRLITGMEWSSVPKARDHFGQWYPSPRVETRYSFSSDAFPNLPAWIWCLFFDATYQPKIRRLSLDRDSVELSVVSEDPASEVLGQLPHLLRIPRPRIHVDSYTGPGEFDFTDDFEYEHLVRVSPDDLEAAYKTFGVRDHE